MLKVASAFWSDLIPEKTPYVGAFISGLMRDAEERRTRADYDTGSITEDEACALMYLAADLPPDSTVIEVGTFIGMSTMALAAAANVSQVYTCDASNDCFDSFGIIRTYPHQTSIKMLGDLAKQKVSADLCFFDGTLCEQDANLLALVTHDLTVYAFHDYNYGPKMRKGGVLETMPRKGIGNVRLLHPNLPNHRLIEPFEGSTLALLVPEVE